MYQNKLHDCWSQSIQYKNILEDIYINTCIKLNYYQFRTLCNNLNNPEIMLARRRHLSVQIPDLLRYWGTTKSFSNRPWRSYNCSFIGCTTTNPILWVVPNRICIHRMTSCVGVYVRTTSFVSVHTKKVFTVHLDYVKCVRKMTTLQTSISSSGIGKKE